IQLVGGTLGSQQPVHPNDHVNMGQSSNDTFPTAMHIAAYKMATEKTIPALRRLRDAIDRNSKKWADVVKIGRTHLEDAVPLTVGQEWSGYAGALEDAIAEVEHATDGLLKLAMGGTAVGTGLNAPAGFGEDVAAEIASMTGAGFQTAVNKFPDRVRGRPAGLRRLDQPRSPAAPAAVGVHRHGRADVRPVRGRRHLGPVRRPRAAAVADGAGALDRLGAVAGGGRLLPRGYLRPFQPGDDPGTAHERR